jgi:radical SAM superfamily enzyme YgiQ (UPF0313 family)
MDVLLSHGYFLAEDPAEQSVMRPYPPLGLLYLSSHLKSAGLQPEVFDSTFESREAFAAVLEDRRPPVVGLYANLMTRSRVLALAAMANRSGAWVVVGGPEPANYAREYLERGVDVVVVGEGERTVEELVPHLRANGRNGLERVRGIAYLDGDEIRTTEPRPFIEDLDRQPPPDRGAIDIHRYLEAWRSRHGRGAVSVITARGCPFTCTWCSHSVYGHSHRRRSPAVVADEVQDILSTYDPELIWYADDVFTISKPWLRDYADELSARGIRVPFETITREDRLDETTVRTLAEMGAWRIWIGAESGSQRILDAMDRRTDADRVCEMVSLLQRHGIEAGMFIMLGYEGEEQSDIEATVDRIKRAGPDIFLTTLSYPIKGTPYHDAVEDRVIQLKDWDSGSDRDFTVTGRHSRRYYRHATRWMVNDVKWHRTRGAGRPTLDAARAFASAKLGRLGMRWTRREVERG